jgi:hypothetical protein
MKAYTIRIEDDLLDKLSYIAELEKRSMNSQILIILERYVKQYYINLDEEDEVK